MLAENDKNKSLPITFLVYIIFISSFILPTGFLDDLGYPITNIFFIANIFLFYLLLIRNLTIKEILFVTGIIILAIITKNANLFHFISIATLFKIIEYKDHIKRVLLKSNIIWISLFFTLLYITKYFGQDGRWIHTSIKEVNMSGLALLCLALIIRKRNLIVGNLVLVLGVFTLSRNYLLAIIIIFLMNLKFVKEKIITKKIIDYTTFFKVFILSSAILLILANYFEVLYLHGELSNYSIGFKRFFIFKDFSNYFRFTSNKYVIKILLQEPFFLLTGIPYYDFYKYSGQIASSAGQIYRTTNAHNFFFSYLRIYGLFSIVIFKYISTILSNVVNKYNYDIYLALIIYALFLGIGFNTYWLYLIVFVLILYDNYTPDM